MKTQDDVLIELTDSSSKFLMLDFKRKIRSPHPRTVLLPGDTILIDNEGPDHVIAVIDNTLYTIKHPKGIRIVEIDE